MSNRPEQVETSTAGGTSAASVDVGSMTVGGAALCYASMGWAVFPLKPGKKTPLARLAPHGFKDATTNLEIIRAWWVAVPTANIGIATGEVSGIDVVDFDPEGLDRLDDLAPGEGPAVRTPRGTHHYVAHAPGRRNSAGKIAPGVDLRSEGGYVVAPPSTVGGRPYRWIPGRGPEEAPREWSDPTPTEVIPLRPTTNAIDAPRLTNLLAGGAPAAAVAPITNRYGAAALGRECALVAAATEGTRRDTLNKASFALGQLVASGELADHEVVTALLGAATLTGLPADEISRTIAGGLRDGCSKPRVPRSAVEEILAAVAAPEALTAPATVEPLGEANMVLGLTGDQRITRFIREMSDPPGFVVHGAKGFGRLTGPQLSRADALRSAVVSATGAFVAKPSKGYGWADVGTLLIGAVEEVEVDDVETEAGQGEAWLDEYLSNRPPMDADRKDEALLSGYPFTEDGHVFVSSPDFREWASVKHSIPLTPQGFGRIMRSLGAERVKFNIDVPYSGMRTTRRFLRFPYDGQVKSSARRAAGLARKAGE